MCAVVRLRALMAQQAARLMIITKENQQLLFLYVITNPHIN
jgi:hypothetical protein